MTSFSGGFRSLTRSRYRRLCSFRFCLHAALSRYFCRAFHSDHVRAALRQPSLQYRCRACRGRNRCAHPFNRHRRVRGRRDGRFRPWAACLSSCLVGFSLGPMGGLAPRSSGPGGESHSSPGHRYPVPWKLNTLSKAEPPESGAGDNAGCRSARLSDALFPAMGRPRLWC